MFGGRRSSILGNGIAINKDHQRASSENTYSAAGVDIAAGNEFVQRISPIAASTRRAGTDVEIGGFGAFFDLKSAGFKDPILVAATDGVGTKLLVAQEVGRHDTVGIDLVAMCVNDIVVQGAEPLFFLDYLATGKLEPSAGEEIVAGIAKACIESGCALVGGETAEMPGMYATDEYDLAGFAVGAVERGQQITGDRIAIGDSVLGLASNGLHSNGFSLVRRIVKSLSLSYSDPAPFDRDRRLGDVLLDPTTLYVSSCLTAMKSDLVHGLAHITGGGLAENLGRILPDELAAVLDANAWDIPDVFSWLVTAGNVPHEDALRTFNMGLGMAVVVPGDRVNDAVLCFENEGHSVFRIGRIIARPDTGESVRIKGEVRL